MPTINKAAMTRLINALLLTVMASGCATSDKEAILPQDGPTMKEVYRQHFSGTVNGQQDDLNASREELVERETARSLPDTEELSAYTRDAGNEIRQIFPRLHNKTLIMYVFPHLSQGERYPVPGYSTAIQLYEKPEYALPGEREEGY